MRIAQVSTLISPVSRDAPTSVESLVWNMSKEMITEGHDVTLFALKDSDHVGKLHATFSAPSGVEGGLTDWHLGEWINICDAIALSTEFDIIHSHGYLWAMPVQRFSRCPV